MNERDKNFSDKIVNIKRIREITGCGLKEAKDAWEKFEDLEKARNHVQDSMIRDNVARQDRLHHMYPNGTIATYMHHNGRIGAMVELRCSTDFVGSTEEFKTLAKELAQQVVGASPSDVVSLLKQPYIKDPKLSVQDLVDAVEYKCKEPVVVTQFSRFEIAPKFTTL